MLALLEGLSYFDGESVRPPKSALRHVEFALPNCTHDCGAPECATELGECFDS